MLLHSSALKLPLTFVHLLLMLHFSLDLAAGTTIIKRPTPVGDIAPATLIPGQPLHFECARINQADAQFIWLKKDLGNNTEPRMLLPNSDDNIEIHNERLTLLKPNYSSLGDYICRALKNDKTPDVEESATIRVRAPPYMDDFGIQTSHSGKSSIINDGDRLELTCRVRDQSSPVRITWLRSDVADDEKRMVTIDANFRDTPADSTNIPGQFNAPSNVYVQTIDNFTKKLVIQSVGPEHRSYYTCMVDNGVTERLSKTIFIRVKDNIIALWPFLGILAELFILFTIIYIWETQRAYKATQDGRPVGAKGPSGAVGASSSGTQVNKRQASGPTAAYENVPLNN